MNVSLQVGRGSALQRTTAREIKQIHGGPILLTNRNQGGARATLEFNTKPKEQL